MGLTLCSKLGTEYSLTKFSARNDAVCLVFNCRQHYYHTTLVAIAFGMIMLLTYIGIFRDRMSCLEYWEFLEETRSAGLV
jgi:hypothetical protein